MLRGAAFECEVSGNQPHNERAGDIDQQRAVGKCSAEHACGGQVDTVARRRAEPAAEKDDEITHFLVLVLQGKEIPPCGGQTPTALFRGRSHQPLAGGYRGTPSPSPSKLNVRRPDRQPGRLSVYPKPFFDACMGMSIRK